MSVAEIDDNALDTLGTRERPWPDDFFPGLELFSEWSDKKWHLIQNLPEDPKEASGRLAGLISDLRAFLALFRSAGIEASRIRSTYEQWLRVVPSSLQVDWPTTRDLGLVARPDVEKIFERARVLFEPERSQKRSGSGVGGAEAPRDLDPVPDESVVSRLRYRNNSYVYFERSFVEDMKNNWQAGGLNSSSHAFEVLDLLEKRTHCQFEISSEDLKFVEEHYDGAGAYRENEAGEAAGTLLGTRSAIVIYKVSKGAECFDSANLSGLLGGDEQQMEIATRTNVELDRLLDGENSHGTVIDLHHALWILHHLHDHESIGKRWDLIHAFVAGCHLPNDKSGRPASFSLSPYVEAECLTACLFVDRILSEFETRYPKFKGTPREEFAPIIDRELKACRAFVHASMSPSGGFAFQPGAEPDIVHTYMGLRLDKHCGWGFSDEHGFDTGIERFVSSCSRGGGYSLLPNWRPSIYATRLGIQIMLEQQLPIPNPNAILKFVDSLKMEDAGRYKGFNPDYYEI